MADPIEIPNIAALPLERPIVFIDLETTGLSVNSDQIVELAVLLIEPSGKSIEKVRRFRPGIPIQPKATEVHGITDADVADEEPFGRRAKSLYQLLQPCDLAGFNIRRFDLPLLVAEFHRVGIEFELDGRRVIDVQQIFHNEEPRSLEAAAMKYLSRDPDAAHSALGDVRTTASVLFAQLEHYSHLPRDLDGLNAYCNQVGPIRNSYYDWFCEAEGGPVFRRGKHDGAPLNVVVKTDPSYLNWMLRQLDLDESARKVIRLALHSFD